MTILGVIVILAAVSAGISSPLPEVHADRFYYFSYGCNMLSQRMHSKIPSAQFVGPALLENYRLDFGAPLQATEWQGGLVTLVPSVGSGSWGTLWELDVASRKDLDRLELLTTGGYGSQSVRVKLQGNGTEVPARVYIMDDVPISNYHDLQPEQLPDSRKPSATYLKVLVKGAMESGVPEEYVNWLKSIRRSDKKAQELEELFQLHPVELQPVSNKVSTPKMVKKFFYFGFGSNMLASRIHIQNPTAQRIGAGKLENYRLDFYGFKFGGRWRGSPATIVPTNGSHVFGSIWEIDMSNLKDLDDQEGVADGVYQAIDVPVHSVTHNSEIVCRAYHLTKQPETDVHGSPGSTTNEAVNEVPLDRKPSRTYLKVLVKGAQETGIPDSYVDWLKSLKHNDIMVESMENLLELAQVQLKS